MEILSLEPNEENSRPESSLFVDMLCCCYKDPYTQLSEYERCPDYLMGNYYIRHGYRVNYSYVQCIRSIFMCSNEVLNIWTHLLGAGIFTYLVIYVNMDVLANTTGASAVDHIVMSSFCVCFLACLLLSAGFHTFGCHSRQSYRLWLKLDLTGITLSLWGCYIPSIFYGFYCFKFWQRFYTLSIVMVMLLNLVFQMCYRRVHSGLDVVRVTFMIITVVMGVWPATHWVVLLGGFGNVLVSRFLPRVIVMYFIGGCAFFFYVSKIPEKLYPGWFDYIGASHQIWHSIIVIAFYWWFLSAVDLMTFQLVENQKCILLHNSTS